ncbi:MAG: AMP-binding protein [bacterium]|nr:AMP-binding protein [bacterium]
MTSAAGWLPDDAFASKVRGLVPGGISWAKEVGVWLEQEIGPAIGCDTLVICASHEQTLASGMYAALEHGRSFIAFDGLMERPALSGDFLNALGARSVVMDDRCFDGGWAQRFSDEDDGWRVRGRRNDLRLLARDVAPRVVIPGSPAPGEIAYLMRTSGSTGRPKCVAVGTEALRRYRSWFMERFLLPSDVIGVLSPYGFDMIINALIPGVAAGARLVFPTPDRRRHFGRALELFHREAVTFINLTPPVADALAASAPRGLVIPSLRLVMFGGDRLHRETVERWRALAPGAAMLNCYGVAEATVTSFVQELPHDMPIDDLLVDGRVPIGRAIPGISATVLNSKGEEHAYGEGELILRGPLLAHGYVGPEQGGFRLLDGMADSYRTGDRVRIDDGDRVSFLGRLDCQVKVCGGVRLDLGEVEARLAKEMGLNEGGVTVVATEHHNRTMLGAFFSPNATKIPSLDALNKRIPDHMKLAAALQLESPPLLSNGKWDRTALERLLGARFSDPAAPAGAPEDRVRASWHFVLGYDALMDVDDLSKADFFLLGGDSLSLVELASQLGLGGDPDALEALLREPNPVAHARVLRQSLPPVLQESAVRGRVHSADDIAVIAANCILPGLVDLEEWQRILGRGCSLIREVPSDRDELQAMNRGSFFSKRELDALAQESGIDMTDGTDLQHAVWLVLSMRMGIGDYTKYGHVGVYVGAGPTFVTCSSQALNEHALVGATPSFIAGRVAHRYDLSGPNAVIDTACSSGLVAVQMAVDALRMGRADFMLAGGVQVFQKQLSFELLQQAGILSRTGQCRPLDARADGYLPGEGAAAVVLGRAAECRRAGLPILAVIKEVATNHDGASATVTAPRPARQQALYDQLLSGRGDAGFIGFFEAHATGTPLGDPMEVLALRRWLESNRADGSVLLSASKGSIGHTHYAAGAFGLLKAIIQIRDGLVYPPMGCEQVNPRLRSEMRFAIPTTVTRLGQSAGIVTSFGLSGTNCALLLSADAPEEQRLQICAKAEISESIRGRVAAKFSPTLSSAQYAAHPTLLGRDSIELLDLSEELGRDLGLDLPLDVFISCESLNHAILTIERIAADRASVGEAARGKACTLASSENSAVEETGWRSENGQHLAERVITLLERQTALLERLAGAPLRGRNPPGIAALSTQRTEDSLASIVAEVGHVSVHLVEDTASLADDLGLSSAQIMEIALLLLPDSTNADKFDAALTSVTVGDLRHIVGTWGGVDEAERGDDAGDRRPM